MEMKKGMKKLSIDVEDELVNKLELEAKDNLRSVGAQIRFILKERYE